MDTTTKKRLKDGLVWFFTSTGHKAHDLFYASSLYFNKDENGLKELFTHRKHRNSLISILFIISGLMYMYYSTVIVIPEIYYRNDIGNQNTIVVLFWISSIVGHTWPALFYRYGSTVKGIVGISTSRKGQGAVSYIKIIKGLSFILLIYGLILSLLFYFSPNFLSNSNSQILIGIQISIILLANAGWAFIISILSSWFPKHIRLLASSIAYNGGLAISFASPFIIMDLQFQSHQSYFTYVALSLGALSMLFGSWRLSSSYMQNRNKNDLYKTKGAELRLPPEWKMGFICSSYPEVIKCNFYKMRDNKKTYEIFFLISRPSFLETKADNIFFLKEKIKEYFSTDVELLSEDSATIVSIIASEFEFVSSTNSDNRYIVLNIKKYGYNYLIFFHLQLKSEQSKEVQNIIDSFA